jgi:hypothetical protein
LLICESIYAVYINRQSETASAGSAAANAGLAAAAGSLFGLKSAADAGLEAATAGLTAAQTAANARPPRRSLMGNNSIRWTSNCLWSQRLGNIIC